ncbi:hypothetical protein [Streptomyces sp. NPDC048639]|uniref:hypothetical protein n=1 Tax=Streptomyces sp. NPDC048639 TaxID=3365581 RepID=UPI0037193E06
MTGFEIAVVIIAGGYVVGGVWDRVKAAARDRRTERRREINGPEPICGCRHHLAYHDPKEGRCYAEVKKPVEWDEDGDEIRFAHERCPCRRYAGPEPLATLYAPEVTGGGGGRGERPALESD